MVSALIKNSFSLAAHTIPFLVFTLAALQICVPAEEPTALVFIAKCLPVLSLIYLVNRVPDEEPLKLSEDSHRGVDADLIYEDRNELRRNIIPGLVFGVLGDAALVSLS